jgi:hypothetical protein
VGLWVGGARSDGLAQVDEALGVALDFLFRRNEAILGWIPRNSLMLAVFEDASSVWRSRCSRSRL